MKNSIQSLLIFAIGAILFSSCGTTRTVVTPDRSQSSKWVNGMEVLTDTSRNLQGDVRAQGKESTVQLMLHLVNKGIQSVLIDPVKIFTFQTDVTDNTSTVYCGYGATPLNANSTDAGNDGPSIGAIVGVGILAALVVGAVYVASKNHSSSDNERENHHDRTEHHSEHGYHERLRCEEPRDCGSSRQAPTYQPAPPQPEWLKKNTLEPGMEMKGMVEVSVIDNIKRMVLVVPSADSTDVLQFKYQVETIID